MDSESRAHRWLNRLLIAWFLVLWFLPIIARGQIAGTVNMVYNLQDFLGNPQAVQRLVITPLIPIAGVGFNGTNILVPAKNSRPTGLNGSVTISNMVTGYPYLVQLLNQAQPPIILASFTNYVPTNVSGTVLATSYLGTGAAPLFGWIFAHQYATVAPGPYIAFGTNSGVLTVSNAGVGVVLPGTNITVSSNGGAFTINSTASGNNGSGTPLLLDPATGLYHRVWIYDDNGTLTLQVPTAGFNPGTPSYPTVMLADPVTPTLYHNLYAYNDGGVFTIQVADATATPSSTPAVPFLLDYSTYFAHTLALYNDNGVLAVQISDSDY